MDFLKSVQNLLKGYKTYILGVLMFLTALEKYLTGSITLSQFFTTVQGLYGTVGVGLVTLRAGVKKVEQLLTPVAPSLPQSSVSVGNSTVTYLSDNPVTDPNAPR